MARNSVNASLFVAGLIACLLLDETQAKINARSGSQIEEVFRKLPSIENEVDSVFDDASFLSSFGPSPNAEKKSNKDVEDLFRRILASEGNAQGRDLSFLSENLAAAGVSPSVLEEEESEDEAPTTFSDIWSNMDFNKVEKAPTSSTSSVSSVESVGAIEATRPVGSFGSFGSTGAVLPESLTSNKVSEYTFHFPTIQHTVFSGPIHLKAHSNVDLSPMDPEIFDVLQSILTPYLQQTIGTSLHAYNLEIDYAPSVEDGIGEDSVVTLMEVKCTFKVISDSIESLRSTDHDSAKEWLIEFFTGPDGYNIGKLIEALQQNSIPVDDIVFVNQAFHMDNVAISEANSQSLRNPRSPKEFMEKLPSGTAIAAVTISVLLVGILFLMHMRKRRRRDDRGGRRRTFSGTFRRFPTGGLRKAAIQKKPAKSQQYLGDSESASNKLSAYGDDYSFSRYGGDYGPSSPSRQSSMPPMTPVSRRSGDEFSMPDNYDSVHERETLRDKVAKTASSFMNPMKKRSYATKSPIPSRAPRRVTANDIASPNEVDDWSIDSYESSVDSASEHGLQRDWNGSGTEMRRPVPTSDPPASKKRREKLSLPFFN